MDDEGSAGMRIGSATRLVPMLTQMLVVGLVLLGCALLVYLFWPSGGARTARVIAPSHAQAASFDLAGHRGARGLCPENTLPAFAKALSIGVTTLETDAVVTADGVIVLHHDLTLDPNTTRGPKGEWIAAPGAPLKSLTLAELQGYDVGRIKPDTDYARTFSHQKPVDGARIPTLASVIDLVRQSGRNDVVLSVEAKIEPDHPELSLDPERLAQVLVQALRAEKFAGRASIQSFDWRVLRVVQKIAPEIPTVYLTAADPSYYDTLEIGKPGGSKWMGGLDIDDYGGSAPRAIKAAGGSIWSPYAKDVDLAQLKTAHELGIRVVVWTLNEPADMGRYIDLGVDGIITDYPDRLRQVLMSKGKPVPQPVNAIANGAPC
jgi:glycerophosphoryl diester phosphodiesterase